MRCLESCATGCVTGGATARARPLLFDSLIAGGFWMFGFYSLQPLLLDLLGRQLVWVAAVGTAVGSLAGDVSGMPRPAESCGGRPGGGGRASFSRA